MKKKSTLPSAPDRRQFITTASATAAAGALAGVVKGEGIDPSKKIKIGFIGTGGRGTGAAKNALAADDNCELWAVADVFQDRLDTALETLSKDPNSKEKINVAPERQFLGLDAYKRVLDSGIDVVILTTPPGFRPLHLRAAVEAGKHIFAEKPMAVDAAGVRHVYETLEMAKGKSIAILAGFCWRYSPSRRAAFKKIMEEGMIGDVTGMYATYYSNHSKPHMDPSLRNDGVSDIEWQIRNWYNYSWLGGGGLVEQAVHSVDKIGWVMGDENPISCRATGGLAQPQVGKGNIFDHYHIAFEYPNNVWCHLASRKAEGSFKENADYIQGTKGKCVLGVGPNPYIEDNNGKIIWQYRVPRGQSEPSMYQVEHDEFFASIRDGEFINDGNRMIHSSMMAIMGRMSAHTGDQITWEEAMNAQQDYFPNEAGMTWDQSYDPGPVPVPGKFKIPGIGGAENA